MRRIPAPSWLPVLLLPGLLVWAGGCTATRTREFTREVYEAAAERPPASRVFSEVPERVREALVDALVARGATIEVVDPGALLAAVPWAAPEEAAACVDLGRVRQVVTQTERGYRSWSPLDFRCDACIVRKGKIVSQETRLLGDESRALDPDRYRLEAVLRARVERVRSGTRVELALDLVADPPDPPEMLARSTGLLESQLLDAVEIALLR